MAVIIVKGICIILYLLVSLAPRQSIAESAAIYNVGYPNLPPLSYQENGDAKGIVSELFIDVMEEAGIDYDAHEYPIKRFYHNIASGEIQMGIFSRLVDLYYDQVVFANESALTVEGRLYWPDDRPAIRDIKDLKGKRVALMLGVEYGGYSHYVQDPKNKNTIITVKTVDQALHLLAGRRVDYYLGISAKTKLPLKRHPIESLSYITFFSTNLYFAVHRSVTGHEELLKRLVTAHGKIVEREGQSRR